MGKALIVCDAPKGVEMFRDFLIQNDYKDIVVVDNGEEAKRNLVDFDYDLCLINSPIKGKSGEQLSIDIAEKNICQVILFVKAEYLEEITERVENFGVITVGRPINRQLFWGAVKLAKVAQQRIHMAQQENKKLQSKLDSLKVVSRAKCLLISYEGMSEEEAHKYIERKAMDDRSSRVDVAKWIIGNYG